MIFFTEEYTILEFYSEDSDFPITKPSINSSALLKSSRTAQHSTVQAINYILKLLANHEYTDLDYICSVIQKLINCMFLDSNSKFYGIFPYDYLDSTEYYHQPDYDFQPKVLIPLLEIYLEFGNFLPEHILSEIKKACITSSFTLSYAHCNIDSHNIILIIFSLICIGETFNQPEILNSGIHKLQNLVYFTLYNDSFMEYNSPGNILLSIEAIHYFKDYIQNPDCLSSIKEIERIMLICFYTHFNPKLMQWTGPVSVNYKDDFISEKTLKRIQKIIKQKNFNELKVPEEYYFCSPLTENKFIQTLTSRGFSYPHWKFAMVASSYNTNSFSLGSFNRDDMWKSRRPCIAYFGTPDSPYCMRVRCLFNNHDFSSGAFHSIQHKGSLLGAVTFSTNRGEQAIVMDKKKTYKMKDLRIRFQIIGDSSKLEHTKSGNSIKILYKQLSIMFSVHHAVFDDYEITYQLTTLPNCIYFDVVLYSGEEKELDLSKIKKAVTAFSIFMGNNKNYQIPNVEVYEKDGYLISECREKNISLKIETPTAPGSIENIFSSDYQYINNTQLETYAEHTKMISGQHRFIAKNNISQTPFLPSADTDKNKTFLKKINNLDNMTLDKISLTLNKTLNTLDNFSVNIAQRYSIHILIKIFNAAKKSNVQFENLIEKKYSQVYNKISYSSKTVQMKKILTETTAKLVSDYNKFQANSKKSDNIAKIIKKINDEYKNPNLSLNLIADEIGLSEAHLSREFHKIMGQSYTAYLLKVRIEKAKALLSEGINVNDVMKQCGYVNFHTFNAAFKRHTGTTARKYSNNKNTN